MWESDDGIRTATTRQCAGSVRDCSPRSPEYGPAGTMSAPVIVMSADDIAFRFVHGIAPATAPINKRVENMVPPSQIESATKARNHESNVTKDVSWLRGFVANEYLETTSLIRLPSPAFAHEVRPIVRAIRLCFISFRPSSCRSSELPFDRCLCH